MKNNLFISIVILAFVGFFLASHLVFAQSISCNPEIKIVNQEPYPASPAEYVKVVFEISGLTSCGSFAVKLNPTYPFSLDPGYDAIQTIGSSPYAPGYKTTWMVPYTVRIADDAFKGDYNLELLSHLGSSRDFNSSTVITNKFNITIQDSRTEFDAVIQESSGSDVSIAIANIGKYAANSVVVRIPEQDYYTISGTDGQMVGNLASGDYTIVGFSVSRKMGNIQRNINKSSDEMPSPDQIPTTQTASNKLRFDIYYTDNMGKRRIVNMELPLNSATNSSMMGMRNFNKSSSTSFFSFSNWYIWVVILIIIIILYLVYRKFSRQIKNLVSKLFSKRNGLKNKDKTSHEDQPEWMKNAKEKEKKK
ncbi:MAG: hypothetical protein WC796_04800 [Candidatus Pacearchaeota archaeon]|jgi:hypothetical protein